MTRPDRSWSEPSRGPGPGDWPGTGSYPGARRTATGHGEGLIGRGRGGFRGRRSRFAEVRALAKAFGAARGADHATTFWVVLRLEELVTNTVTHGYSGSGEGPVWVTLAAEGPAIEITYEAAGPAFRSLHPGPAPPLAPGGAPSGLGLALVRGLRASAVYARVGDRKRVTLTVSIRSSPATPPPTAGAGS